MSSTITNRTHLDNRGYVRTVPFASAQIIMSYTDHAGILRGLHYREPPEEKLVLCRRGSIYDVTVNLETGEWFPLYMGNEGMPRLVKKGFAHGFQTLEDCTEVFYVVSELYDPDSQRGIRYDSYGIKWPLAVLGVSERDRELPLM